MAEISAKQLSERFGVNMTKVSRAIKAGEITKRDNPNGKGYLIDVSEAQRWVDNLPKGYAKPFSAPYDTTIATPETTGEIKSLEAQIALLREMLNRADQNAENWREIATRAQTLLENHAPAPASSSPRGLWGIFGRKAA